jgi:hypothetical protein
MSKNVPLKEPTVAREGRFGPDGRDRRKRHRAQVALPVHIRGGVGSLGPFQDVGKTMDVSRDGLLVMTTRSGYVNGEILEITVPWAGEPKESDTPQRARVVRVTPAQNHRSYALALEYQKVQEVKAQKTVPSGGPAYGGAYSAESDITDSVLSHEATLKRVYSPPDRMEDVPKENRTTRGNRTSSAK